MSIRHELPGWICGAGGVFARHVWCEREQRDVCVVSWRHVHADAAEHGLPGLPERLAVRGGLFCAAAVPRWHAR